MSGKLFAVGGDNPLAINIRKVMVGKIEALLEDVNVMEYQIAGLKLDQLRNIGCTEDRVNLWMGFTDPKINPRSRQWVEMLDEGQTKLEESGRTREIYKKYKITPR